MRLQITKFIGMLATGARGECCSTYTQYYAVCRTGTHTEICLLLSTSMPPAKA